MHATDQIMFKSDHPAPIESGNSGWFNASKTRHDVYTYI